MLNKVVLRSIELQNDYNVDTPFTDGTLSIYKANNNFISLDDSSYDYDEGIHLS